MSSFKLNKKAFGTEVLQSKRMERAMAHFARPVLQRARATAPVFKPGPHPGQYKGAFKMETSVRTVPPYRTRRAVATVGNESPEARWVEYGSRNNPRRRTLGKALDAARGI